MKDIVPAIKILMRNPLGPLLIMGQIGITIAILSALFYSIFNLSSLIFQDSNVNENNLGRFSVAMTMPLEARGNAIKEDLRKLTSKEGVRQAAVVNRAPLDRWVLINGVSNDADKALAVSSWSHIQMMDHNGLDVMGVSLIEGRNFSESEIRYIPKWKSNEISTAMVTKSLAHYLFGDGPVLGKQVLWNNKYLEIVGITEDVFATHAMNQFRGHALFISAIFVNDSFDYLMHTEAPTTLSTLNNIEAGMQTDGRERVLSAVSTIKSLKQVARNQFYYVIKILLLIYILLIGVCGFGVIGLTAYRVANSRQQIAIRRALGATRWDICRFFLTENMLIFIGAMLLGALLVPAIMYLLSGGSTESVLPWYAPLITGSSMLTIILLAAAYPAIQATQVSPASVSGNLVAKG